MTDLPSQTTQAPEIAGSPTRHRSATFKHLLHTVGAWCAGAVFAAGCVRAYWDGYNHLVPWRSLAMLLIGACLTAAIVAADVLGAFTDAEKLRHG